MSTRNESSSARDGAAHSAAPLEGRYLCASGSAQAGKRDEARRLYRELQDESLPARLAALVANDLATLELLDGDARLAERGFERALSIDSACTPARRNLEFLNQSTGRSNQVPTNAPSHERTRVAILSLLFNWPSTGGGTVHTAETGKFLSRAGYEVKHFYAQYPDWGMGRVDQPLEHPTLAVRFESHEWNAEGIRRRFRAEIDRFAPDAVIVTDSWNTKVLLAEAVDGYPYYLRLAALECLCPLNNVRMLFDEAGRITVCPRHQLATPDICRLCVSERARFSGALHQAERALAGFGDTNYAERLQRAVTNATAVLVVNPLIAEMVRPYVNRVEIIPSGFDRARFPWPWHQSHRSSADRKQILFAGLVEEAMKGFHVLDEACRRLWAKRQDFELVATADPQGIVNDYTRYIGWLSQTNLPAAIRAADVLAFPTVAEEALGRTAVEAMGVGRPVVAARIGGLQFTVVDEATGLLFEPGNAADLAAKLERLLDDEDLRRRLGVAGRRRFEEHYTWDVIIERNYRPMLAAVMPCRRRESAVSHTGVAVS